MTIKPQSSLKLPSAAKTLRIHCDDSARGTLQQVLTGSSFFTETVPSSADLIIFGSDDIPYIKASPLYKAFPHKSICITESDTPTFRLPGLYASNTRSWITRSRTRTINYFISQIDRPNIGVHQEQGKNPTKKYLYSFMGASNSWTRKRLLRSLPSRPDTLIQATDAYNHWISDHSPEAKTLQQQQFAAVMAASRYILCPRGCGNSSYRLFESMALGIAPVVISDTWRPVEGVDWRFALFIPESQLSRLDQIVRRHADEWEQRGYDARQAYEMFFAPAAVPKLLSEQLLALMAAQSFPGEPVMALVTGMRAAARQAYWSLYGRAKLLVLKGFQLTNVKVPIPLHVSLEEQLKAAQPKTQSIQK